MINNLNNNKSTEHFRKELRNSMTPSEAVLWHYLKGRQIEGKKFRRQHSIGVYILDFYCASEKLGIEVDGEQHLTDEGIVYDKQRAEFLNSKCVTILRFHNWEVIDRTATVLLDIQKFILSNSSEKESS